MTTFKRDFKFDNNFMVNISKNIKKYRKLSGITQKQLAVDINKSYDFIRRLEYKKGEIGCSIETLYRISKALDVSIDDLIKK